MAFSSPASRAPTANPRSLWVWRAAPTQKTTSSRRALRASRRTASQPWPSPLRPLQTCHVSHLPETPTLSQLLHKFVHNGVLFCVSCVHFPLTIENLKTENLLFFFFFLIKHKRTIFFCFVLRVIKIKIFPKYCEMNFVFS